MPPKVALLLCCLFCLYVFRKDAKWHPALSPALWLPTLWIWRCASRSLGAWVSGGDPEAAADVGWYDPAFLLCCTILGWVVLLRRKINWSDIMRSNIWLLIFFAFMAVSILWAPDAFVTTKRWVRAFGDLTMALVVASNPRGQLEGIITVLRRCGYLLVPFSIVLAKYFPDLGRAHAKHWASDDWIGVAVQKNNLGMLCMIAGIWLMWEFWNLHKSSEFLPTRELKLKRIVLLLYALMTAYLFNGGGVSRSMTSIVALVLGIIIFWQLSVWRTNPVTFRRRVVFAVGAWLVLEPGCQAVFGQPFDVVLLGMLGRDPTLTGRSELWHDCLQIGMQHPILGAGYMGFWTDDNIIQIAINNTNAPTEAHSGYLEIFLNLGIVGLVLFLPVIISALAGAWRLMRTHFEYGRFCVTLLLVMLIHNFTESGFPRATYLTWFVFLLVATNVWRGLEDTSDEFVASEHARQQPRDFATVDAEETA